MDFIVESENKDFQKEFTVSSSINSVEVYSIAVQEYIMEVMGAGSARTNTYLTRDICKGITSNSIPESRTTVVTSIEEGEYDQATDSTSTYTTNTMYSSGSSSISSSNY